MVKNNNVKGPTEEDIKLKKQQERESCFGFDEVCQQNHITSNIYFIWIFVFFPQAKIENRKIKLKYCFKSLILEKRKYSDKKK